MLTFSPFVVIRSCIIIRVSSSKHHRHQLSNHHHCYSHWGLQLHFLSFSSLFLGVVHFCLLLPSNFVFFLLSLSKFLFGNLCVPQTKPFYDTMSCQTQCSILIIMFSLRTSFLFLLFYLVTLHTSLHVSVFVFDNLQRFFELLCLIVQSQMSAHISVYTCNNTRLGPHCIHVLCPGSLRWDTHRPSLLCLPC